MKIRGVIMGIHTLNTPSSFRRTAFSCRRRGTPGEKRYLCTGRGSSESVEGLGVGRVTWHHRAVVLAGVQDQQL
jgi:hypothetical protein